jgi:tRNA(Ile)-lysidine synthase TilS/MesJ
MQHLMGMVRRCVDDYNMIDEGDRIAVGVSGGKDSLALLMLLAGLRQYYPKKFQLQAITVDMGRPDMDFTPVAELCQRLDVPYTRVQTQISDIVFHARKEKNPCSMCAKMRRGALHDAMKAAGCNKVALGHHYDDAVETFLLSLFYEGRLSCFQPVTWLSRMEVTQIRPMLYVGEKAVESFSRRMDLPVVVNTCPADKNTKRQEVKDLLAVLQKQYPDLKTKIFGAMQRFPLPQWGVENAPRRNAVPQGE